jgi:hypothetical protein
VKRNVMPHPGFNLTRHGGCACSGQMKRIGYNQWTAHTEAMEASNESDGEREEEFEKHRKYLK